MKLAWFSNKASVGQKAKCAIAIIRNRKKMHERAFTNALSKRDRFRTERLSL